MFRTSVVIAACLVAISSANPIKTKNSFVDFSKVPSEIFFLNSAEKSNEAIGPYVTEVEPNDVEQMEDGRYRLLYVIGTGAEENEFIGLFDETHTFPEYVDVGIKGKFVSKKVPISQVQITVYQNSPDGKVQVLEGGQGAMSISYEIRAFNTKLVDYSMIVLGEFKP